MQTSQEIYLSSKNSRANFWIQALNEQGQDLFSAAYNKAAVTTQYSVDYSFNKQRRFGLDRLYYGELEDLLNLMTTHSWTQVLTKRLDVNQILILRSEAAALPVSLIDFIERHQVETPKFCQHLAGHSLLVTADPSAAQLAPMWIFYRRHQASSTLLDFLEGGFTKAQVVAELAIAKAHLEQQLQNALDSLEFLLAQPKYTTQQIYGLP